MLDQDARDVQDELDELVRPSDTIVVDCTGIQRWIDARRAAEEKEHADFRARCALAVAVPAEEGYW